MEKDRDDIKIGSDELKITGDLKGTDALKNADDPKRAGDLNSIDNRILQEKGIPGKNTVNGDAAKTEVVSGLTKVPEKLYSKVEEVAGDPVNKDDPEKISEEKSEEIENEVKEISGDAVRQGIKQYNRDAEADPGGSENTGSAKKGDTEIDIKVEDNSVQPLKTRPEQSIKTEGPLKEGGSAALKTGQAKTSADSAAAGSGVGTTSGAGTAGAETAAAASTAGTASAGGGAAAEAGTAAGSGPVGWIILAVMAVLLLIVFVLLFVGIIVVTTEVASVDEELMSAVQSEDTLTGTDDLGTEWVTDGTYRGAINLLEEYYEEKIDRIKAENADCEDVIISGTIAPWRYVFSVYFVLSLTNMDKAEETQGIASYNKEILLQVFDEFNTISYSVKEEVIEAEDADEITNNSEAESEMASTADTDEDLEENDSENKSGETESESETAETVIKKTLLIDISYKTVDEIADRLGLDDEQMSLLESISGEGMEEFWLVMLYGVTNTGDASAFLQIARNEIGTVGGDKYRNIFGSIFGDSEWCSEFVVWCANTAGLVSGNSFPVFSYSERGRTLFKQKGQWADGSIVPSPGMIIFFDEDHDGEAEHVGIVESVDSISIHTIEGNINNSVVTRTFGIGYDGIMGYGCPDFSE